METILYQVGPMGFRSILGISESGNASAIAIAKLDADSFLIEMLRQPRSQFLMNRDERSNDLFGQFI